MFRLKSIFKPDPKDPYSKIKPPEAQREFYLEENKTYQYLPKERIEFIDKKALIFQSKGFCFKFLHLGKLLYPIIGVTTIAMSNVLFD